VTAEPGLARKTRLARKASLVRRAGSSRKAGLTRKILRVFRRGPALVVCVSLCVADCLLRTALRRMNLALGADVLHRWSSRILRVIGVKLEVVGPIPGPGLIVSNHLSYLDIMVFSTAVPCIFVSKSEVKWWPLVGWVAQMTGTIFVDRSRRSQTYRVRPQMAERLDAGARLVLFPEGTSSDGRQMLPFRSSLFEAAVDATAPATAACISYDLLAGDGDPSRDVCYWGDMTMFPHLIKLLSRGGVQATVRFADRAQVFSERKQAALELQNQVKELVKG
jgi:lyso-ornithine lipid O-acyltransferase